MTATLAQVRTLLHLFFDAGVSDDEVIDVLGDGTANSASSQTERQRLQNETIGRVLAANNDAFVILRLPRAPKPTSKDIENAFRQLAKLLHPDKCQLERAPKAYELVTKAKNTLLNSSEGQKPVVPAASGVVPPGYTSKPRYPAWPTAGSYRP
eukprot:gene2808-7301_t